MKKSVNYSFFNNQLNQYKKNGYVVLKSIFKKKDIQKLKNDLSEYLKNDLNTFNKKDINYIPKTKIISSIHNLQKCLIIKKLSKNKNIKKIAKIFIGEDIKEFGAELFAKPKKKGAAVPDHQDNYYWNLNKDNGITMRFALDKSSKNNGNIYFYKGSHRVGIQPHKPSFVRGSSQEINHKYILKFFKKFTPSLNEGDLLIHHSAVIHGSKKNNSNFPRMGLNLRYIPKKSKINLYKKKIYDLELKSQRKKFNIL